MKSDRTYRTWLSIPPWIIIGAVLILGPVIIYFSIESIHRQKESATRLLLEKGAALIRSFEAGARTGMMGMHWGGVQLQRLLMETAQQPDIVYLVVTDEEGTILAHSDVSEINRTHGTNLNLERIARSSGLHWRQVRNPAGPPVFEVYRQFSPTSGHMMHMGRGRGMMMRDDWTMPHMNRERFDEPPGQIIFVGLDMGPVESARREDAQHTVIMAVILLLFGFAGIVLLFLSQAYRSTRISLSRVKAFSDNLVENMPIGLAATDTSGRVISFNQTAESLLELPARNVLGKPSKEVLPQALESLIQETRDRGGGVEKEVDCAVTPDRHVPLDVLGTPLEDEAGRTLGHVLLFRDLSEIQRLKREILRSQRLASIGRLAAGIAHEIRNPLSSIKGFATYFRERYREVPEDQKTAEIMIQEVERLNRVIGELLEFARPMALEKRPTSLQTLLQHTLKLIEPEAARRAVRVRLDCPDRIEKVRIDPDRMKQVLLNLYLNAIVSMEEGGTMTVSVESSMAEGTIELSVSDAGSGIAPENLAHVYDPYFTTKSSGTGLGLAIVHKIVEAHGGRVKIDSRPGRGTRVTVLLPEREDQGIYERKG